MKNRNLLTLFAIVAMVLGNSLCVGAVEYSDKDIEEIVNKEDGVYLIKKDDKGKISSCVAVVSEEVRFGGRHKRIFATRENAIFKMLEMRAAAKISELINPESVKTKAVEEKDSNGKVPSTRITTSMSTSIAGHKVLAKLHRRTKKGNMACVLVLAWSSDLSKTIDKVAQKKNFKRVIKDKNKQ